MRKTLALVCSTGFALFSMFFGSGNLVFPLVVGQQSEGHFLTASMGILLSGVVVPFLGVFGIMLYEGSSTSFFRLFGRVGTFAFSLAALALMGPFGVLPRCLTVAHGALQVVFPELHLVFGSLVFCVVIYFMSVNRNKIVPALGALLTPLLLVSIAAIAFFGLKGSPAGTTAEIGGAWPAFSNGFFRGYQTMDLLAAFFFSSFIIKHLRSAFSQENDKEKESRVFLKSSLLGAGILSGVYVCLVLLGSLFASELVGVPHQDLLGHIAVTTLGPLGAPCLAVVVVLACLTTAVVLASLFADFLRQKVLKEKLGHKACLLLTLLTGFLVSTFGFSTIAAFIGPVLEVLYPALIVLTVMNVAHKITGLNALDLTVWSGRLLAGFKKRLAQVQK